MRYVVDTNIWGAFLGKNQKVRTHLRERLAQGHEICVISIVYFELIRWLELRNDLEKLQFIKRYWATLSWYDCTKYIWDEAVRLWVTTIRQNNKREDADILIAAFTVHLNATVVTTNTRHFEIFSFPRENWVVD
jgi:predicted nucleic acid-binding protein